MLWLATACTAGAGSQGEGGVMARQHLIPVYQAASAADVLANVRAVRARLASLDRSARIAGIEHHRVKTGTVSEIIEERQHAIERAEHLRQLEINKERSDAIKAAVMIEQKPILNGGLCIYQEPIGPSIIGLVPIRFVASMTNFSVHDFRGPWRSEPLTWYRQVAMWLYRTATNLSLPQIGAQFGGRDHTTVLHAFRRVNGVVQTLGLDKSTPFITARKLIEAIDNGTFGVHTRGKGSSISES